MRKLSALIRIVTLVTLVAVSACRVAEPSPPSEATVAPVRTTNTATAQSEATPTESGAGQALLAATDTAAPQAQPTVTGSTPLQETSLLPTQPGMWLSEELGWSNVSLVEAFAVAVDHAGTVHLVGTGPTHGAESGGQCVFYRAKTLGAAWSEPLEVFKTTPSSDQFPKAMKVGIAVDSHGAPHAVWATDNAISYATAGEDGSWSSSAVVDPAACPNCRFLQPEIAIDGADRIHVMWAEFRNNEVYWSSRPLAGEWSAPLRISSPDTSGVASEVSLSADADGTLHAVWRRGDSRIMYADKLPSGPWSTPIIISGASHRVSNPVLVVDSANRVHVIWRDTTRSPDQPELVYTSKLPGESWGQPAAVPASLPKESQSLAMAVVGGDDLIVMWGSEPIGFAAKLAGQSWSGESSMPDTSGRDCVVTGGPEGSVHVIWESWGLQHAVESIDRIALAPAADTEYTAPPGLIEFAISSGPGTRSAPAISGAVVAWSQQGEQGWDILAYDLLARSEFPITSDEGDQLRPAVSGKIVVWQDERATMPRIYGRDLSTGQTFPITAESSPQFGPDISGSTVVFRDWRKTGRCSWGGSVFGPGTSCDWDIWGADLDGGVEFPIRTENNIQMPPRVSGNTVTWAEEQDDSGWIIYVQQPADSAQPSQIAAFPGYGLPRPEIDGNIVIWEEQRDGVEGIFGYHLLTKDEFLISTGSGYRDDPDISGNIVVWADKRSGSADIYGYDLASGKEFPICTAPGDQSSPAIDGDVVVWVDTRNWHTEIYGARLPSASTEQTEHMVPAPTPTLVPTPTPDAPPTPARTSAFEAPRLISPLDNSVLDSLCPVLIVDLGIDARSPDVGWEFSMQPGFGGDWSSTFDGTTVQYAYYGNLTPNTTYSWQVKVRVRDNPHVPSEEWSFTTPNEPASMSAPVLVSPADGITIEPDGAAFEWDPVAGAVLYQIGWGDYDPDHFFACFDSDTPVPVSPSQPLEPGKTYYWGVRTRDDYSWSEWTKATFHTSP